MSDNIIDDNDELELINNNGDVDFYIDQDDIDSTNKNINIDDDIDNSNKSLNDNDDNDDNDYNEDDDDDNDTIDNSINYDDVESDLDVYFKYGTNNHKLDGKHSLKRDTILNGKLNESNEIESQAKSHGIEYYTHDSSPSFDMTSLENDNKYNDDVISKKKLSEDVYNLLKNNTDLDFTSNRRKPNKATFNNYYKMILNNIDSQYSKSEIFVELSYYFTDNIFNMYKLLDKKYATIIIMELREKGFLNNLNSINFM